MAHAFEKPCRKIVRSFMPGQRRDADVLAVVGQLGVDLVRDDQQVVLLRELGDLLDVLAPAGSRRSGCSGS